MMTDRHEEKDGYGVDSSTRGGASRRGGYGDDQGTRVGQPDHPERSGDDQQESRGGSGPSTQPVDEGLEGAVLSGAGDQGEPRSSSPGSTGAGAEAAEGIHGAQEGRSGEGGSSVERPGTGPISGESQERAGSEPLRGRTGEHESGYGGRGGEPKGG